MSCGRQGSLSDPRRTIDRGPETGRLGYRPQGSDEGSGAEGFAGRQVGPEESETRMAAAGVEDRGTSMLRTRRLVPVAVRRRMRQMALGHEVHGALHNLGRARKQGEDQD